MRTVAQEGGEAGKRELMVRLVRRQWLKLAATEAELDAVSRDRKSMSLYDFGRCWIMWPDRVSGLPYREGLAKYLDCSSCRTLLPRPDPS